MIYGERPDHSVFCRSRSAMLTGRKRLIAVISLGTIIALFNLRTVIARNTQRIVFGGAVQLLRAGISGAMFAVQRQ